MSSTSRFPLDLEKTGYSYIERPNSVLVSMLRKHVLERNPRARILDVGCGAGANPRAMRPDFPNLRITGIEPNARAGELASQVCDEVYKGYLEAWLETNPTGSYDAVVLSDVLEHIPDPVHFLGALTAFPGVRNAIWVISVPNYAVWYNRMRTLAGRFDYAWSGLYDRTHLRFFTRESVRDLLAYAGLSVFDDRCSPSMVQSLAPILRRFFQDDVESGQHLSLPASPAYRAYEKLVEPAERQICQLWPEMLGFQIVSASRLANGNK